MSNKGLNDLMLDWYKAKAGTAGTEADETIRKTVGTVTIATSDTTMGGTVSIEVNGKLSAAQFTTADMQDSDSTLMTLVNEAGGTAFTSGTKAESTSYFMNVGTSALYGTTKVVMTAEGTQSASRSVPYLLLTER